LVVAWAGYPPSLPVQLSKSDRVLLSRDGHCLRTVRSTSDLVELAKSLGEPRPVRSHGPIVHDLYPLSSAKAAPRTLSALHGLGPFPLHTDAAHHRRPPRWLVMRCIAPGRGDTPTRLADSRDLEFSRHQRRELARAVWRVRNGFRSFLASAVLGTDRCEGGKSHGALHLRYDAGCMTIADRAFAATATLLFRMLADLPEIDVHWEPNVAIVIDNWRTLHGRVAVEAGVADERRLQRVLIGGAPT
jgi:hypothetical protein